MKKTKIIAEAGVNHNGQLNLAKKLIYQAAKLGADYIKFQSFKADKLLKKDTKKANYQIKNKKRENENQYTMLKKLELKDKHYKILFNYCKKYKIKFLLSFFDIDSLVWVKKLRLKEIKIPSGEINNMLLLNEVGKLKKKVILSSGISSLLEIRNAVKMLIKSGTKKKNITVLHCNTEYPTPLNDVNLRAMVEIKKKLNISVGYSDHTPGIEASISAVSLGAEIIEKHFTINPNFIGPDHSSSLSLAQLGNLIKLIRNTELILGKKNKKPSKSEKKNKIFVRKSIVAKKNIDKGEKFSRENLTVLRPGTGISADKFFLMIGKKAKKRYLPGDII